MIDQARAKERLRQQHTNQAITLAMQGRWEKAARLNRTLLEHFPSDVDAYNRLGKALTELGEYAQAREAYTQALQLNAHNRIASRNLQRLSCLEKSLLSPRGDQRRFAPHLFIQDSGKTAVASLQQLAPKELLARIATGDEVYLQINGRRLVVQDKWDSYIGTIAPRYELRLIKLIEGGNRYSAAVGSVGEDRVKIIIRETYQHPSQKERPSFPPEGAEGSQPPEELYEDNSQIEYALDIDEELTEDGEEIIKVGEKGKVDFILNAGFHEVFAMEEPPTRREDGHWDSQTDQD